MGTYFKHIRASSGLISGDKVPNIYEAIMNEASKSKWDNNGTAENLRKAKTISHMAQALGILLVYEGNDTFTVDLNGTYSSVLLPSVAKAVAPFMNDGEIWFLDGNSVGIAAFENGSFSSGYCPLEEFMKLLGEDDVEESS